MQKLSKFHGEYGLNLDVWVIKSFNERPHALSHHKSIKWRGHPLSSMVIDNSWFCSMVWLQGTLYLSHPWYFTTHGFGPWYCPKAHCNNVIKRLYAFSIRERRIFGILHLSYFIELLSYWVIGAEYLSEYGLRGEAQRTLFEPHPSMSHIYSMFLYVILSIKC